MNNDTDLDEWERYRLDEWVPGRHRGDEAGRHRADRPTMSTLLAAAAEDAAAAQRLEETIQSGPSEAALDGFVLNAPTIADALDAFPRIAHTGQLLRRGQVSSPRRGGKTDIVLRFGDREILPSSLVTFSDMVRPESIASRTGLPLVPATAATAGDVVGVDRETGALMARASVDRGVWRTTMVGNFPSGSKKAKAKLAPLPRRYQLVFGFANSLHVDSFGGCELGSAFWQVLEDREGWRGQRGLANSAVGANRIGNGNLWRHRAYRCLDLDHFTITGLPSGEFGRLDMPVVLLGDNLSGAIHAEVTIHNFARRYSTPGERIKVINHIIRLVDRLTDAGIPVILRGDFNSSMVWQRLEKETELVKAAPDERSIDMILVTEGIKVRRPQEIEKDEHPKLRRATDHRSVTTVEHWVPVDLDCPRELPRLPRTQ